MGCKTEQVKAGYVRLGQVGGAEGTRMDRLLKGREDKLMGDKLKGERQG